MPLNLTNQFLIAMPQMGDPNFSRTVTYVCAHNDEGAMGIVINRPLEIDLREIFSQMDLSLDQNLDRKPIYNGGPVQQDRGFVIHRPAAEWGSTLQVGTDIGVSTSRDILEAMAAGEGPNESLVALGYAGWDAGQLEAEFSQNAWLSGPADSEILFSTPAGKRWDEAARLLGVDLSSMSHDVGHA
ncbi:MAG: YqgE/AlgH family protein [Pseudomonadota bacterium]